MLVFFAGSMPQTNECFWVLAFSNKGCPQIWRNNSPSFSHFSRARNLLFHSLSQQKVIVIITVTCQLPQQRPRQSPGRKHILEHFCTTSGDCLLKFYPEVAQNSPIFPVSEKSMFSTFVNLQISVRVGRPSTASIM